MWASLGLLHTRSPRGRHHVFKWEQIEVCIPDATFSATTAENQCKWKQKILMLAKESVFWKWSRGLLCRITFRRFTVTNLWDEELIFWRKKQKHDLQSINESNKFDEDVCCVCSSKSYEKQIKYFVAVFNIGNINGVSSISILRVCCTGGALGGQKKKNHSRPPKQRHQKLVCCDHGGLAWRTSNM